MAPYSLSVSAQRSQIDLKRFYLLPRCAVELVHPTSHGVCANACSLAITVTIVFLSNNLSHLFWVFFILNCV